MIWKNTQNLKTFVEHYFKGIFSHKILSKNQILSLKIFKECPKVVQEFILAFLAMDTTWIRQKIKFLKCELNSNFVNK